MKPGWCAVCCSRHDLGPQCPGELLATGTERFGWRVQVGANQRVEQYAILVAPSRDLWRARIVTLPNMLWSVPGGRGTMKFVGRTASEAEGRAIEFVRDFCKRKKYRTMEIQPASASGPLDPEAQADAAAPDEEPRHLCSVPVRFGVDAASYKASTADLSPRGLFIITNRPLPQGTKLKLVLELSEASLPLNGTVAWLRAAPEDGRPAGMGVLLHQPPALYQHFVERLG